MVMNEVVHGDLFSGEKEKLAYWTGTASRGAPVLGESLGL